MSDEPTGPDRVDPSDGPRADPEAARTGEGATVPIDPVVPLSARDTTGTPGRGSLVSPLMSGRSLEPMNTGSRKSWLREHLRGMVVAAIVLLLVSGVVVAKVVAEGAARSSTDARVEELRSILDEASPRDFLAFDAGVKVKDSVARRIRDQDGFVNLRAGADMTTIRIQPSGWWAGFTERCIVVSVYESKTVIDVVKRSCVRVDVSGS